MQLKTASLTPVVKDIIVNKHTEPAFSGEYEPSQQMGTYLCKQCGLALFRGDDQFHSGCGWPSFDNSIADHVRSTPDQDGKRTEIVCARCNGHLGHVFQGEYMTTKNIRHCVNSLSVEFVPDQSVLDSEELIVAAGCFWGVEYYFKKVPGVLKTEVGYTGGTINYPTYETVCTGSTGHVEALRVIYDPTKINYATLIKYFFEIHDPSQQNGQGSDIGPQYLSAIFYYDNFQKQTTEKIIAELAKKIPVATTLHPVSIFWPAEKYHQDYYTKQQKIPYCHHYVKKF